MSGLKELQQALDTFAEDRDWRQYHTPKNLVMAIAAEAGELLHIFEWLKPSESIRLSPTQRQSAKDEMADVLIYLVRLADVMGVDLIAAAHAKIEKNAAKYPAPEGPDAIH